MMKPAVWLAIPLMVAACGRDPQAPGADSPGALIRKLSSGLRQRDPEAVRSCFDLSSPAGERVAKLLVAGVKMLEKQRGFEVAVRQKFGARFAEKRLHLGKPDPSMIFDRLDATLEKADLRVGGDQAVLTLKGVKGPPGRLVCKAGVWFFGLAPYLPEDPNLCDHVEYVLEQFRERYVAGIELVEKSRDGNALLEGMARVDDRLNTATRKALETAEPFLVRYR